MPRFAANLSMMFNEAPFMERFAEAAACGFEGVEFLFPYAFEADAIAAELKHHGLQQVLFNLPPGDWDAGERGIAALPGREAEFRDSVETALHYTIALGCPRVHAMAGLAPEDVSRETLRDVYLENLRHAARRLAADGLELLIEPINTRDMPGYFLNHQAEGHAIVAELGEPNVKVQMDFYHTQIMDGDIWTTYQRHRSGVGHLQIAGVPERHEPDSGEVNYPWLFEQLDADGFEGWVGCEYKPRAGTRAGLGWFEAWKRQA
ncbi:2-oxo-tetronate isomerase [Chromohalobacter sp. HP20-39]|uniref:2-oxo-tetronate isomerase n=1 Tax=Chromohalobacter sp. HP20-39 TaxID=3079306 RepID=UPI00294B0416|nr:2-oxo-tetronate isomerase [Chromohalobacter sp. HP20-39]MDV6318530.1 hydroxypyruvate isomerase family protein [Chromohalobacter sp. HP20-39]